MLVGTDTGVGKTYVGCCILRELAKVSNSVGAYKPVASGVAVVEDSDAYLLWKASGFQGTLDQVNPQRFEAPLAPPVAAALEGKQVDEDLLLRGARNWRGNCDALIIEGAGGLMSPISHRFTNAHFARMLNTPLVLVAQDRLGVVHQVLTTIVAAEALGLRVVCVVLNQAIAVQPKTDPSVLSNRRLLEQFLKGMAEAPKILSLTHGVTDLDPAINWRAFCR
jgi:dethiobiotin synthetase